MGTYSCVVTAANYAGSEDAVSAIDFSVNATVGFKKVTFNRKKGTATLRVALTGKGRLDVYGKGVANAQRKHAQGTTKITVRTSGKALIKLSEYRQGEGQGTDLLHARRRQGDQALQDDRAEEEAEALGLADRAGRVSD